MREIWRNIDGAGNAYAVSNLGRIKRMMSGPSTQAGHILKSKPNRNGYHYLTLNNKKIKLRKSFYVHLIVARHFLGPGINKQINHVDGNKNNNAAKNLGYVTAKENIAHAYKLGLRVGMKGMKHPFRILTDTLVRKIRRECSRGVRQSKFVHGLGLSRNCISKVVLGLTWSHVK